MSTDGTVYAARIRYTELLERGKINRTELRIYRDGAQIIPTAVKYSLWRPDGTGIVEEIVASIEGDGTLYYSLGAAQLADTLPLGESYIAEWICTITGQEYIFRRMVALCRRRLYPTVSDADLIEEYANLNDLRSSSLASFQPYIDASWGEILRRIRNNSMGYEYLVTSPESFHDALKHLTLHKIFKDFHSALGQSNGTYLDVSQIHYSRYQSEYDSINMVYDQDHEGKAIDADQRTKGRPVIYTVSPPPYRYYRRK